MTPVEKNIWAAAFAAEFISQREFIYRFGNGSQTVDDISGFGCAEIADIVVEKYREAVNGPDAGFLLIVKERKKS